MAPLVRLHGYDEMMDELDRIFVGDVLLEEKRLFLFTRLGRRAGEEMTPPEFVGFVDGAVREFAWDAAPLGHAQQMRDTVLLHDTVKLIDALTEEGEGRDHLKLAWEQYLRGAAGEISAARHHRMPI